MISARVRLRRLAAGALLTLPFALSACSAADEGATSAPPPTSSDCPAAPVKVVVSVDQWGDIVSQLGGQCATVTTIVASSSVDPHDFEPAPRDAALFEAAQLVVLNGGHYDEWAVKLAATSAPDAPVVNALEASGLGDQDHGHEHGPDDGHDHAGDTNPHVWYDPGAVTAVADNVTAELKRLSPEAADYFGERRSAFAASLTSYDEQIASIKAGASGKTYAATESVFDDMAAAVGLQNRTPEGYQAASANETEPSPADLDAFLRLLGDRGVDVLIYNTQTEGSVPEQIRSAAEDAGVPVVEVTETLPPDAESFQTWQMSQLRSLAGALGVSD
ncbi:ABC transporter substrate-binding protein [Mycolicibacterium duvalii]|uniref:ABC transporter substrate-binding protein n=1 Tax=Mycolicibacterium duvalii TaxID=39688 RepID=A0A7I7K948_9MYCO|nr:ABC transporter substrate-binding protein [Mycolicibacterium duvalii]